MIIKVNNLNKSFLSKKTKVAALEDISFEVNKGELVAIIGPDGAGKSTLIKVLCGLMPFDSGEIEILGRRMPEDLDEIKLRIGYLSQSFTLYKYLTVYENMDYFASLFGIENKKEKIENILGLVGLLEFRDRLAKDLSGGMKQKLSLACALIRSPDIIFLDEPTTGVDPRSRREIFQIIKERKREGITVLFSTYYIDEGDVADRIIILDKGRIIGNYNHNEIISNQSVASVDIPFIYNLRSENIILSRNIGNRSSFIIEQRYLSEIIQKLRESNIPFEVRYNDLESFYLYRVIKQ
jgi:ABC-2 type transport system ATP-binding protein